MAKKPVHVTYIAAGGVLTDIDGTRVLALIRPAIDEVRLPKGHVEPDETSKQAALREVTEESGYDDIEIIKDLGQQLVAFPLGNKIVQRTEHYYLMRACSYHQIERPDQDKAQFFTVWVSWDEAVENLTFVAEQEWIRRARQIAEQTP